MVYHLNLEMSSVKYSCLKVQLSLHILLGGIAMQNDGDFVDVILLYCFSTLLWSMLLRGFR